jgi:ABC-2 type transport system permease protein
VSATGATSRVRPPASLPGRTRSGVIGAYRVERRKLAAQLSTRLLMLVCVVAPFAFGALLRVQSGTPTDTLFGAWTHSSGFAVSLVVLSFAGAWGFPVTAGVLAGDMFSSEDRFGTWKTLLTRSCTRPEVFIGKLLAAASFAVLLVVLTAAASLLAGVLFVGAQPLVGLGGQLLSPGRCWVLVAASWALMIGPVLAYTSLALLFSVTARNGIVGVIGPILVALATQLLALIGRGVWAHLVLIGSAFDGWHGLFAGPPFSGPLVVSSLVSIIWIAGCLTAAWLILRRRDFLGSPGSGRPTWVAPARIVTAAVVVLALLAVAGNWGPTGVTPARLRASLTPEFNNITLLQQRLFGRTVPAGARLDVLPHCSRRGGPQSGPGDWTCSLDVYIPQPGNVPFQQTPVSYDVTVQSNGCYKAESPPAYVGQQTIRDVHGHTVTNPLFVVYGCFNTL